jgi:hypothetical protein
MLDHARKPAAAARRTSSVVIRRTLGAIAVPVDPDSVRSVLRVVRIVKSLCGGFAAIVAARIVLAVVLGISGSDDPLSAGTGGASDLGQLGAIAAVLLAGWALARHAERRLVARGAAGS